MNVKQFKIWLACGALANVGFVSQALASGYEKSVMWGARSAGVGGVATPNITGSEAIYFNPAGLVGDKVGRDLTLNVSPTYPQLKGPINNNNDIESSEKSVNFVPGVTYGATVNEKFGYGVGYFVSAGSKAKFTGVTFPGFSGTAETQADLVVIELSLGGAYKVNEKLKLGLAWRYIMASAEFSSLARLSNTAIMDLRTSGLTDTDAASFRFGAQYQLSEKTVLGFNYRSEVNLTAEGTVSGSVLTAGLGTFTLDRNSATAKTTFPMQATLGVQHDFNEAWRFLAEYAWTQYSRVGDIMVEGRIVQATLGINLPGAAVKQEWKDQHNVRLAGEYLAMAWPVRFGYVVTTQVTSSDYARPTFAPPGLAHTFTVGTGKEFILAERPLEFNAAGEYTTAEGDGNGAQAGVGGAGTDIRAGKYSAHAVAAHLALTYKF